MLQQKLLQLRTSLPPDSTLRTLILNMQIKFQTLPGFHITLCFHTMHAWFIRNCKFVSYSTEVHYTRSTDKLFFFGFSLTSQLVIDTMRSAVSVVCLISHTSYFIRHNKMNNITVQ